MIYPAKLTVPKMIEWIGSDVDRAHEAIKGESDRDAGPRTGVLGHCHDVIAADASASDDAASTGSDTPTMLLYVHADGRRRRVLSGTNIADRYAAMGWELK